MKNKECLNCKKTFQTNTRTNYCSDECKTTHKKELRKKKGFEENNKKYDDMIEGKDYVTCKECGLRGTKLQFHIQMVHKMSIFDYKQKHDGAAIVCGNLLKKQSDSMKGENNPGFNHGGKFSAFSDKFIGETTKEEAIAKMKKTKNDNPQNENTKLEYYTSKGYSEQEAINILSKRQSTFSLSKCIEQLGEVEGKKRWLERQEKWLNTLNSKSEEEKLEINRKKYPNIGRISKAEQEIFDILKEKLPDIMQQKPLLNEDNKWFYYDICYNNKIIEYHGDYWHANPLTYDADHIFKRNNKNITAKHIWENNNMKIKTAINNNYEILVIWETDYNKDKNGTIEKCLNFLKQ